MHKKCYYRWSTEPVFLKIAHDDDYEILCQKKKKKREKKKRQLLIHEVGVK